MGIDARTGFDEIMDDPNILAFYRIVQRGLVHLIEGIYGISLFDKVLDAGQVALLCGNMKLLAGKPIIIHC